MSLGSAQPCAPPGTTRTFQGKLFPDVMRPHIFFPQTQGPEGSPGQPQGRGPSSSTLILQEETGRALSPQESDLGGSAPEAGRPPGAEAQPTWNSWETPEQTQKSFCTPGGFQVFFATALTEALTELKHP